MESGRDISLPDGLPSRFGGTKGLAELCRFLGIANRGQKQTILDGIKQLYPELVPALPKKTAQRLREALLRFYRSPVARRRHWWESLEAEDERRAVWPSLEDRALAAFDPCYRDRALQSARVDAVNRDFPGLVPSVSEVPGWKHPALAVLPDLQQAIAGWESLRPENRSSAAVALFAVATLLDDVRILRWAAETAAPLAKEFAFAGDGRGGERPAPPAAPATEGGAIPGWERACGQVAELAAVLGSDAADSEVYGRFREQLGVLESLRGQVLTVLDQRSARLRIRRMVARVEGFVSDSDPLWLRGIAQSVGAQWCLACLGPRGADIEQVVRGVRRVQGGLEEAIKAWRAAHAEEGRLKEELAQISSADEEDMAAWLDASLRKAELLELSGHAARKTTESMRSILKAASPEGEQFDPRKDYVAAWRDAKQFVDPAVLEESSNGDSSAEADPGQPPGEADRSPSDEDVGARGPAPAAQSSVAEEIKLLALADQRIRARQKSGLLRNLLVATIAKVGVNEIEIVELLSQASEEDILAPGRLLRSVGKDLLRDRGAAGAGTSKEQDDTTSMNAALAAVVEPRELDRRIWSAQVSVLLPEIEFLKRKLIDQYKDRLQKQVEERERGMDAEELEIGYLNRIFREGEYDSVLQRNANVLARARNRLAHCVPLKPSRVVRLIEVLSEM